MKMKKIAVLAATIITAAVLPLSASAWVDNAGNYHPYHAHQTWTCTSPRSIFTSGLGWQTKKNYWKSLLDDGCVVGTMKPYYNRDWITSDNAAEVTASSITGYTFDGYVSCNGRTQWSLPGDNPIGALSSVGTTTRSVSCNGYQTVYYGGTAYWD